MLNRPFSHSGDTGEMIGRSLLNLLLSVLTLSLYRFWGKTHVRRLLWGGTQAWGDPVEYTGTGKELFLGFLLVLLVIYMPLVAGVAGAQALTVAGSPLGPLLAFVLYFLTVLLVAVGLYRARRYQLSRTVWRGIRGGQTGSGFSYALRSLVVWISGLVFAFVAIGLGGAVSSMGQVEATALFLPMLALAALLILALPWAWYRAAFYRNLAAGLSFEGSRFVADPGAWSLLRLAAGNMIISLFSLGILRPWAALRTFRYTCRVLAVEGEPDFAKVAQGADAGPKSGEGLVAVFDGAGEF